MGDLSNTQFFQVEPGPQISAKDILDIVYTPRAARRRSHADLIPFKTKRPGTHMCRGAFVE